MDQINRNPSTEYLLQGSVLDESIDILLHRLKGICDNSEEGGIKFKEHEMVYSMKAGTSNYNNPAANGNNSNIVSVRIRKQLLNPDQPATLCYIGYPEAREKNLTTIRTCLESSCTQNVCTFIEALGFKLDFDFLKQGWLFKKNKINAKVSKVFRLINSASNIEQSMEPLSNSHLIEVSTISNASNEQAAIDVHNFSDQLKPLAMLDKIDARRLGM